MKESFKEVVDKLRAEREFQNTKVSPFFSYHKKKDAMSLSRPIAAEILMMDHYIHAAQHAWTRV